MKPKTLAIAALSALGLTALGLALRSLSRPAEAGAHAGDLLFPDLLDSINNIAAIQVATHDESYEIASKDGTWGVAEKGNYPVEASQITKTLLGFAELRKAERKTSDPTRYAEIGVQDLQTEGATSKLVTLRDAEGKELAALIVGERRSGRGKPSVYVRRVGDPQSWLVEGDLEIHEEATAWLDKQILEVKRDQVRAVETKHPDGDVVLVSKGSRDDTGFQVEQIPPDRELKYPTVANGMGGALEYLNLEDVIPAAGFEMPEGEPVRTSYWTFDGMRVDVAVFEKDAKTYATFRASHDAEGPPGLTAIGPVPEPEPEPAAEDENALDVPTAEGEVAEEKVEQPRPPEDVRAEAEKLNARLEPWIFQIPAYNKTNFAKRMTDMLKEVEAPAPAEDAVDAPVEGQEDPKDESGESSEDDGSSENDASAETKDDGAAEEEPPPGTPPESGEQPPGSDSTGSGRTDPEDGHGDSRG